MPTTTFFETLTQEQQEKIQHGSKECAGCVRYIGGTERGEHTYFWHYGASAGSVVLPVGHENPGFSYDTGEIFFFDGERQRTFTLDGEDLTSPFQYLCHLDVRKLSTEVQKGLPFLNDGSYLPEHAAKRLGVEAGIPIEWVGHIWLAPWDLSKPLTDAAVALTIVYQDNRRVIVL